MLGNIIILIFIYGFYNLFTLFGGTSDQETGDGGDADDADDAEPAVEEPREMTLDEYRAMQSTLNPRTAKTEFNIRKAGEGCDDKQWKRTYVLKKKVELEESDEEEYEVRQCFLVAVCVCCAS